MQTHIISLATENINILKARIVNSKVLEKTIIKTKLNKRSVTYK